MKTGHWHQWDIIIRVLTLLLKFPQSHLVLKLANVKFDSIERRYGLNDGHSFTPPPSSSEPEFVPVTIVAGFR